MSYCVNCGVELESSLVSCPLCNTPVINPNELPYVKKPSPYPEEMGQVEVVKRKDWAISDRRLHHYLGYRISGSDLYQTADLCFPAGRRRLHCSLSLYDHVCHPFGPLVLFPCPADCRRPSMHRRGIYAVGEKSSPYFFAKCRLSVWGHCHSLCKH